MKLQPQQQSLPKEVRFAVTALEDKQAGNLRVLDLSDISDFTDHFIICTGDNQRQVQALAEGVIEALKTEEYKPLAMEGYDHASWVLIDYGHFLVHVFDPEAREYYRLEGMWTDAPDVTRRATA